MQTGMPKMLCYIMNMEVSVVAFQDIPIQIGLNKTPI